jgi:hypothetical protein
MEQIGQAAEAALSTLKPQSLAEKKPIPTDVMELIFTRLTAQLGSKIESLFGGLKPAKVKDEWALALSGYTKREVLRGLDACQTRIYAVNLGEFLHLCRPALDPEYAWLEACEGMKQREAGSIGAWSHPAVYRAARGMAYELRNKSFKECRKSWEFALAREFREGWDGEHPAEPPLRLEVEQRGKPPTPEQKAKLDELMAKMRRTPAIEPISVSELGQLVKAGQAVAA